MTNQLKSEVDTDVKKSEEMEDEIKPNKSLGLKLILFIFSLLVVIGLLFMNIKAANPSNQLLYIFKRFYEKTQLGLKFTPIDKLNYLYNLLDKRLAELIFIVESGNSPYVLETASRYSTTAGQITELITQNDLRNESNEAKEKLESHLTVVENLPQKYAKKDEEIKYIIDDTNYLNIYIAQLSSFQEGSSK